MVFLLWATALLTLLSLVYYRKQQDGPAVGTLMAAGLCLRFFMARVDPFLHDFDEKYHALVAKNMLTDWARPVLRAQPVLPYDFQTWCCNHVWVHKQPLFLWQMAASMQLFGVNEWAVRLPSAVLSTLLIGPVYRLGKLTVSRAVGYWAALLVTFAHYQLELISGWQSVDHNDAVFLVYVTASVWAYVEGRQPGARLGWWNVLVGLLAGAAVLCKWLPGLVVFAAWGLDILLSPVRRQQLAEYAWLGASTLVALAVFLPWQRYIHQQFPVESAFEQDFAARHFWEAVEGQGGPWYFYITNLWYQYQWLVLLIGAGLGLCWRQQRPALRPVLLVCGVVFTFFSCSATKMPSYTYVVSPLLLLVAAVACAEGTRWLRARTSWALAPATLLALVLVIDLRPDALLKHHTTGPFAKPKLRAQRQQKLQHTAIYRQLDALVPAGYVVFNAPSLEDVDAMFYSHRNVYAWWPSEAEYRALQAKGINIAALADHAGQTLPAYMREPTVLIIRQPLEAVKW